VAACDDRDLAAVSSAANLRAKHRIVMWTSRLYHLLAPLLTHRCKRRGASIWWGFMRSEEASSRAMEACWLAW